MLLQCLFPPQCLPIGLLSLTLVASLILPDSLSSVWHPWPRLLFKPFPLWFSFPAVAFNPHTHADCLPVWWRFFFLSLDGRFSTLPAHQPPLGQVPNRYLPLGQVDKASFSVRGCSSDLSRFYNFPRWPLHSHRAENHCLRWSHSVPWFYMLSPAGQITTKCVPSELPERTWLVESERNSMLLCGTAPVLGLGWGDQHSHSKRMALESSDILWVWTFHLWHLEEKNFLLRNLFMDFSILLASLSQQWCLVWLGERGHKSNCVFTLNPNWLFCRSVSHATLSLHRLVHSVCPTVHLHTPPSPHNNIKWILLWLLCSFILLRSALIYSPVVFFFLTSYQIFSKLASCFLIYSLFIPVPLFNG